jgi:lactoylglutathione lyase
MRFLHTMVRVTDLENSLRFYRDALGFEVVSRNDYEKDRFTLVFLRAPGDSAQLELTYNWDTHTYTRGDAYGHVAFDVSSIEEIQARLRQHGFDLSWGPGLTPNGRRRMAFIDDPDGYEIELLQEMPKQP